MGTRLIALAAEDAELEIVGAIERQEHPAQGSDAGEVAGAGRLDVPISHDLAAALGNADVAVAFVNDPPVSVEQARLCAAARKPLVVGTTGMALEQDAEFAHQAAPIAVVKASNFSVGITVLLRLVEQASSLLGPTFDCEIVEAHHTRKKDAPSGTALSLAEAAARGRGWELSAVARHGREGLVGERPREEIGIHAVRAGDIVGHHTVLFGGTGEALELAHRAHSRDTFAAGALRAAKWVANQAPGLYDMRDVLGLR